MTDPTDAPPPPHPPSGEAVRVRRLDRYSRQLVDNEIGRSLGRHVLEGGSLLIHDEPTVVFRVPQTALPHCIEYEDCLILPWGWPDIFGNSLTFSLVTRKAGFISRVMVHATDPAYVPLCRGRFIGVFETDGRPVACFDFDYSNTAANQAWYTKCCNYGDRAQLPIPPFPERDSHFWHVYLRVADSFKHLATPKDQLSLGWITFYADLVGRAIAYYNQLAPDVRNIDQSAMLPTVRTFIQLLEVDKYHLHAVVAQLDKGIQGDPRFVALLLNSFGPIAKTCPTLYYAFTIALLVRNNGPTLTKCGKRLTWFNSSSLAFEELPIAPDGFRPDYLPRDYWAADLENHRFDWGHLIGGNDVPIKRQTLLGCANTFPRAEDVGDVNASANALMDEAIANKKWTIPPKASVALSFGPFERLEMIEIEECVYCVCRAVNGEFAIVSLDVQEKACDLASSFVIQEGGAIRDDADKIESAMKLLLAAIVRDFWVVEEREKVFATKTLHKFNEKNDSDEPIVVYLPRIKYTGKANIAKCEADLGQEERRAHYVRAHLRKAEKPSGWQLNLAERYGFKVPVGYTFVRPHERGKKQREVIFRSRSALHALYEVVEHVGDGAVEWFKFERDVYGLMQALGFDVEHIAANRQGDHGVDVYATKGSDFEQVKWVIQCKCYSPARKCAPNTIRELCGALSGYPSGTRGMVVTTSTFTHGAIREADRHGIRIVNGKEFYDLIGKVNG